jgi:adenosine deaminase
MAIPLVDLHVHLRGTLSFAAASAFAKANRIDISGLDDYDHPLHKWKNFEEFLRAYDVAGSAITSAAQLSLLAKDYLAACSLQGVLYVEFMASPLHYVDSGLSYEDFVSSLSSACQEMKVTSGIVTCSPSCPRL